MRKFSCSIVLGLLLAATPGALPQSVEQAAEAATHRCDFDGVMKTFDHQSKDLPITATFEHWEDHDPNLLASIRASRTARRGTITHPDGLQQEAIVWEDENSRCQIQTLALK